MRPPLARLITATRHTSRRRLQTRTDVPPYPVTQKCPTPTCDCAEMPSGLDIEQHKPLNGTMVAHSEQLLIASGQADWARKIEDEKDTAPWGALAFHVKNILGKGGEFHNPYHNVSVNTCSFEEPPNSRETTNARVFLFPSFRQVDAVDTEPESVHEFVKTFLLPQKLHSQHDLLSAEEKERSTRDAKRARSSLWAGKVRPISAPTIMVCSHHTRDSRCGVLGPLLHAEFTQYINRKHSLRNPALPHGSPLEDAAQEAQELTTFASHPEFRADVMDQDKIGMQPVNVGMISHVGGHAWAGNVIVYIPPDYQCNPLERVKRGPNPKDATAISKDNLVSEGERGNDSFEPDLSALAGKCIWYGRVEPKHVEGIVEQTIGHGQIIGELFRGGVNADGSIIRI